MGCRNGKKSVAGRIARLSQIASSSVALDDDVGNAQPVTKTAGTAIVIGMTAGLSPSCSAASVWVTISRLDHRLRFQPSHLIKPLS